MLWINLKSLVHPSFSISLISKLSSRKKKNQVVKSLLLNWSISLSMQTLSFWGHILLCRKISQYFSMKLLESTSPKLLVALWILQFFSYFCISTEQFWVLPEGKQQLNHQKIKGYLLFTCVICVSWLIMIQFVKVLVDYWKDGSEIATIPFMLFLYIFCSFEWI